MEPINYGKLVNQFPQDTVKSIWELERINTRFSVLFKRIYINKEIQPKKHIQTHSKKVGGHNRGRREGFLFNSYTPRFRGGHYFR